MEPTLLATLPTVLLGELVRWLASPLDVARLGWASHPLHCSARRTWSTWSAFGLHLVLEHVMPSWSAIGILPLNANLYRIA